MKIIGFKIWAVIIIVLVLMSLYPFSAKAQTRSIVNATACSTGGIVGSFVADKLNTLIGTGLDALSKKLTGTIANRLGLDGLLSNKVPVNDADMQLKYTNKEQRMDIIARCIAREVVDKMFGNILNVVRNHGRDNGPSFIKNWRNFATGGQYRGENVFRLMLTNTKLCNHFNQQVKDVFRAGQLTGSASQGGAQGSIIGGALRRAASLPPSQNTRSGDFDPYALKANCSLPAGWSMENYQKDFSGNGGWLAFATLTKPENNILGSFNLANQEAAKQRALEQEADRAEAEASGGYLGRRGRGASESCLVTAETGQCIVYKDVLTPGSTLQQSVAATVQQEIAWVTNADELGEVISSFTGQLLNRMLNLGDNNDSRLVDPADLPTYVPLDPGTGLNVPLPDGDSGPIEYPDPEPAPEPEPEPEPGPIE